VTDGGTSLELTDVVGTNWRMTLAAGRLDLRGDDGDTASLDDEQIRTSLFLRHSVGTRPVLQLRLPERALGFRLSDDEFRTIGTWLGRDLTARRAVGSFAVIAVLCGLLWIIRSMPGGAEAEAELADAARSFDPAGLLLGAIALGSGLAARFRPHRGVLVTDAAWCTGAAIDTGWRVYVGVSSGAWLIGSVLLLALAWGQIRLFFLIGELPTSGGLGPDPG
jgi:hypothetical protein